jgi:hypothetical protein
VNYPFDDLQISTTLSVSIERLFDHLQTTVNQNTMKFPLASIIAGASAILLSSCATTQSGDENAPTGPPSATARFEGGQASYYASAGGGSGTLTYQGKKHPFTVTEIGAGGSGAQKVSAAAKIYNLKSLSDFEGTYNEVRSGLTIITGTEHAKLTNSKGVVIYVEAETTGLASSTGASKLIISLK